VAALLSPDTGVADVLANFTDAKAEGRDQISGQTTVASAGTSPGRREQDCVQFQGDKPVPSTVWIVESGDTSWRRSACNTVRAIPSR